MEEMQDLQRRYEELAQRIENIDEVGLIRLQRTFNDFKNLDSMASIYATKYANDTANDPYDKLEVLQNWSDMKENIRLRLIEVQNKKAVRLALYWTKKEERNRIQGYRDELLRRVNEYKFELEKHQAVLEHSTESFAREMAEDTIRDDQKHINKAESLIARFEKELARLNGEINILTKGGKLDILQNLENEELISEENFEEGLEETPTETLEETEVLEPETLDEDNDLEDPTRGLFTPVVEEPEVTPEEPTETPAEEVAETPEEPEVTPEEPEVTPEEPTETPDEPEETPEREVPDRGAWDEEDDSLDEPQEAEAHEPSSKLWKKIKEVLPRAAKFLLGVAIAVHTGITAHNTKKTANPTPAKDATLEDRDDDMDDEVKDDKTADNEEEKHTDYVKDYPGTPSPTPAPQAENVDKEPTSPDTSDILLGEGETVYDTKTGVEITSTGYKAASDGTPQATVSLDHKNGYAVVHNTDLNKDTETKTKTQAQTQERTGQEKDEKDYQYGSEAEEKAAQEAIDAEWEEFMRNFEDNVGKSR